jgi:hypothetical protein
MADSEILHADSGRNLIVNDAVNNGHQDAEQDDFEGLHPMFRGKHFRP